MSTFFRKLIHDSEKTFIFCSIEVLDESVLSEFVARSSTTYLWAYKT